MCVRDLWQQRGQELDIGQFGIVESDDSSAPPWCATNGIGQCSRGAIESEATDLDALVTETLDARVSERACRLIDHDEAGAMEMKKREGYF